MSGRRFAGTGAASVEQASGQRRATRRQLESAESELIGALLLEVELFALFFGVLVLVGCVALWGHVQTGWLIAWVVLFNVEGAFRFLVTSRYRKSSVEHRRDRVWRTLVRAMNFYSGVVYGLTALVLLLPLPTENLIVLVCVFAGVYALVCTAANYYWPIIYISGIPAFIPLALMLLSSGRPMLVLSACVIAFVALMLARIAWRTTHALSAQIEATAENALLMEQLSIEKNEADRSRREAERAVVEKSRFIAAASHDLRQPLHAMSLFHGLLDKHCKDPETRHLSEMSGNCIGTLIHQFDSLLDMSRLDAGMVAAQPVHVHAHQLIDGLVERFRGKADTKGLLVEADVTPDAAFFADPLLLERILSNLLSNAIDYTDSGNVLIRVSRSRGDMLEVEIKDTGVGIPLDELGNVFDEYYRLQERENGAEGFGLGLAIVARLCTLLGVDIDIASEVDVGTRFRLRIPAGVMPEVATGAAPVAERDLVGSAVLIIDDDPDILDGMRRTLEDWGCVARTAESARQACGWVMQHDFTPDLIVCDFRLGGDSNGIEVANDLLDLLDDTLPVIMITGDSSSDRLTEILGSGFDVLHKPVTPSDLRAAVSVALDTHRAIAEDDVECVAEVDH